MRQILALLETAERDLVKVKKTLESIPSDAPHEIAQRCGTIVQECRKQEDLLENARRSLLKGLIDICSVCASSIEVKVSVPGWGEVEIWLRRQTVHSAPEYRFSLILPKPLVPDRFPFNSITSQSGRFAAHFTELCHALFDLAEKEMAKPSQIVEKHRIEANKFTEICKRVDELKHLFAEKVKTPAV